MWIDSAPSEGDQVVISANYFDQSAAGLKGVAKQATNQDGMVLVEVTHRYYVHKDWLRTWHE